MAHRNALKALLDVEAAAKYLAISERKLWGLTAPRGPLACVRLGRTIRYQVADLEGFVAARRIDGAEAGGRDE